MNVGSGSERYVAQSILIENRDDKNTPANTLCLLNVYRDTTETVKELGVSASIRTPYPVTSAIESVLVEIEMGMLRCSLRTLAWLLGDDRIPRPIC